MAKREDEQHARDVDTVRRATERLIADAFALRARLEAVRRTLDDDDLRAAPEAESLDSHRLAVLHADLRAMAEGFVRELLERLEQDDV